MKIEPSLLDSLRKIEWFIFDNYDKLFVEFGISKYAELLSVSISSVDIKITYALSTGRHIADHIDIEDYNAWVDKLNG
jgi:hypothetical protein